MSIDQIMELENEKTGLIRKYPKSIFDSLVNLCLQLLPAVDRERAEAQVYGMVGEYIDTEPAAEPLRMAAAALFPELEKEIRFNTLPTEQILIQLKSWANGIFTRYGSPVWLVGSAIGGIGRDVDVRVILPDHDFVARFHDEGELGLEVGKQGRWAALFLRMNVDFQIQKASEAYKYEGLPRIRLDSCTFPEAFEPPDHNIGNDSASPA